MLDTILYLRLSDNKNCSNYKEITSCISFRRERNIQDLIFVVNRLIKWNKKEGYIETQ